MKMATLMIMIMFAQKKRGKEREGELAMMYENDASAMVDKRTIVTNVKVLNGAKAGILKRDKKWRDKMYHEKKEKKNLSRREEML
jgi:homoaconitase/3-isopropylmalate dehydratase large subunit